MTLLTEHKLAMRSKGILSWMRPQTQRVVGVCGLFLRRGTRPGSSPEPSDQW